MIKRVGKCNRCGICCLGCPYIILINPTGKRLIGVCSIYGKKEREEKGCDKYPQYPDRLLGKFCGYRFIDTETGKDVTQYRKNKILCSLNTPPIDIVIKE